MTTRGVVLFANNNTEIDYLKIACINAKMIAHNLKVPVTLITDKGTLDWGMSAYESLIEGCFENTIVLKRNHNHNNPRTYTDTTHTKTLQFYNFDHGDVYSLSPYDETLMIDVDYLIMSSALNNCWGSNNDVMVSHRIHSPGDIRDPYTRTIDTMGIKLYWATVVYFRKSSLAEHLFNIVNHIQHNYDYYRDLYFFSNGMYRNDYAVSIAIHMLNGFIDFESVIPELPIPGLLMAWDNGDIYDVDKNRITLIAPQSENQNKYLFVDIRDTDVHIMNKWAINRFADKLISLYNN